MWRNTLRASCGVVLLIYTVCGYEKFYLSGSVDEVLDNLIVQPKLLSEYAKSDVIHRQKRYANHGGDPDVEKDLKTKIFSPAVTTLEIEDWVLLLEENVHLSFGRHFEEEWISADNSNITKETAPNCKFYTGTVLYDAESQAIITICEKHYYGFFTSGGRSYFIEPTTYPVNSHIVYKAKLPDREHAHTEETKIKSNDTTDEMHEHAKVNAFYMEDGIGNNKNNKQKRCSNCDDSGMFNLTGDLLEDGKYDFTMEDGDVPYVKDFESDYLYDDYEDVTTQGPEVQEPVKMQEDVVGYIADVPWDAGPYPASKSWNGKPPLRERWLELTLAVDHSVISFHGKDRVRQYIMALMNIMSAVYKDASLESNLHLVMARLVFYDDPRDSQVRPGNAKRSLEAVNRWNYRLIGRLPRGERPHDVAVWLTRLYLGGPSGYAPVAGACDRSRSTALNRDEGLASAFIIAHEVAHILGLTHDGDERAGNKCAGEVQGGTIMAPTVTANFRRFRWSSCSKEEFHRIIKQWTCLLNPPRRQAASAREQAAPYSFTMDEQCRMEYGDGYSLCKNFELAEPCSHLWCGHKNSSVYCITKKGPPVEGTQCGFDKWCVEGYCQTVDGRLSGRGPTTTPDPTPTPPTPRAGGWSSWSPWTPCNTTCGYGTRTRTRLCDNPEPEPGGASCGGVSSESSSCRAPQRCAEAGVDPRARRCAFLGPGSWLPVDSDGEYAACRLSCFRWDTGEIRNLEENLPDGTSCSYESEHHICVKGQCRQLGCDGVENSTAKDDRCGECEGRGDHCIDSVMTFHKAIQRDMTKLVELPKLSRHISARVHLRSSSESNQIVAFSLFHLALKGRDQRIYKLTRDTSDVASLIQRRGAPRSVYGGAESEGPAVILAGAAVRAVRSRQALALKAAGPLNGGLTIMMSAPEEYLDSVQAIVEVNFTLAGRPAFWQYPGGPCSVPCGGGTRRPRCSQGRDCKTIPCNTFSCNFMWVPGKWEHCSATCGLRGVSHREVYCIPSALLNESSSEPWRVMVDPHLCSRMRLPQERPCNRRACPAYWIEEPWTKCSSTCGPGISIRPTRCSRAGGACGLRPESRWRSCRTPCSSATRPCLRDRSDYCALASVSRYCSIPSFERLCCKSCRAGAKHV